MRLPKAEELATARESTAEKADRHSDDINLRLAGFQIVSRPNAGPAVWGRQGRFYTQQEAVRKLRQLKEVEASDGG